MKADYGYYWSYVFTDAGILRVQIVSRRGLFSVFLLLLFVWSVLFVAAVTYLTDPTAVVLLGISELAAPLALTLAYYWILKRRVSSLSLEGLSSRKSTVKLDWPAIDSLEIKNRQLKIRKGPKTYKVAVREEDREDIFPFIMSRAGEKVSIE